MIPLQYTSNKVFNEQVRLLYSGSLAPILVSVLAAVMLCWSLLNIINLSILITWLSFFILLSIFRLTLGFSFKRDDARKTNTNSWYKYFLIGNFAIASIWGAGSFLLFPENSPQHQTAFFIIIVGVAAGGVSSLSSSLPVAAGYLSLMLGPLLLKTILLWGSSSLFTSSLLLLFWFIALFGSARISRNIEENIQLRLQSVDREKSLKISEQRYRHIFDGAPIGIVHYDVAGIIVDCNEELVKILGSSRESLIGLDMLSTIKEQKMSNAVTESLAKGEGYYEGDYKTITSRTTIPIRVFFKAIKSLDGKITGGVGTVEDFTEKKRFEEMIQYHGLYDSLTGLPNRRLLLKNLRNEISRARRHGFYGALLFLDLDNFKTINDSLGHSVGDELLKVISQRLIDCTREEDTAARMGGDEFVIIATELDDSMGLAAHKVRGIAEKIRRNLVAPCLIEGQNLQITPSIGISLFPTPDKGVDDVLKQADTAMYWAKSAGRNAVHFFLPSMQEAADERFFLITELRKALETNQLKLYFQPLVDEMGSVVGAETLLRWHHPERGVVAPVAFIQAAEETGFMRDIGRWVLKETCQKIKQWTDDGSLKDFQTLSVNISGVELEEKNFVNTVTQILDETAANPSNLVIELTEGSLVSTGDDTIGKITALQQLGIKFSVDDFGTGYSSLSYLKSLPLNTLKIDRSFVNDIKDGDQDVVLVDTIIMMAHNLGLQVIAEGVETKEELHYLTTRGCRVFQGFHFSPAVNVEKFVKTLESGKCDTLNP